MNADLGMIITGFTFGFGFAMAQTFWGALYALIHRALHRAPKEQK